MTAPLPPSPSQELIYLDPDDDLATVRAKLESCSADEIYVVVPRGVAILRTPLEFRVLARLAGEIGSEIILVSPDASRRRLAANEGFQTRRSPGKLRLPGGEQVGSAGLAGIDWLPVPSLGTAVALVAALAVLAGINLLVLPVYRVYVTPAAQVVRSDFEVRVDPELTTLDVQRAALPGETVQTRFEVVGSVPASGLKNVPGDRASGEVTLVNNRDTPVVLPPGTIVATESNVRFQTQAEARLRPLDPVGVKVPIQALEPGPAGNVPVNAITRFASGSFPGVTVTNLLPTSGGNERPVRAVSDEDLDRLREQLDRQAREQALVELQSRVGADRSLPPHGLRVNVESRTFDRGAGDEADRVTGRMTVSASAVAFSNQLLNALAERLLAQSAGSQGHIPSGQLRVAPPQVVGVEGLRLRLRVQAEGTLVRSVEPGEIAAALRGKTPDEARAELSRMSSQIGPARLEVWPAWALRAFRVEVDVSTPG